MSARSYLCTYNNPPDEHKETLESLFTRLNARYLVGQVEKGENGTVHLQFFVNFEKPQRLSKFKGIPLHAEKVIRDNGASDYCMKEDTRIDGPWEFGTKPLRRNNATDWAEQFKLAKEGKFNDISPEIAIKHWGNLKRIHTDMMERPPLLRESPRLCLWYWGEPGTGKSRTAKQEYPNAYPKSFDHWWMNYHRDEYVLLDDFGLIHMKGLVNYLKKWCDPWANPEVPVKFGQDYLTASVFVVTSNYSLEDPRFEISKEDRSALMRRFKVVHFDQMKTHDE